MFFTICRFVLLKQLIYVFCFQQDVAAVVIIDITARIKRQTSVCLTLMVVGCTECGSSPTIWAFTWQINKMMESQSSRRGCVFMIRAAVWRIYAQTNVTALIISICLIIYETERFIATCWMWEQGNEKQMRKTVIKVRFIAAVGQWESCINSCNRQHQRFDLSFISQ